MKNSPVAFDVISADRTGVASLLEAGPLPRAQDVHLLRGRDAVRAKVGMLQALCRRTGQDGAMHWLEYFLNTPDALEKIPALVLVGLNPGVTPEQATEYDLMGAVLLHEYKLLGWGTRVFATDDTTGQRTVIAPADLRMQVAEEACRALAGKGVLATMISLQGAIQARDGSSVRAVAETCQIVRRTRAVPLYLPLSGTLDGTLATLGRHTRRNLRYYRRRLEMELDAEFVSDVAMDKKEFLAINRASTNPVPDALAGWRYDAVHSSTGMLFSGVRGGNGRWLSLIGGRRHLQITEIDWQVNLAGLPRYSLSTVMRSYLLEHEVALGTRELAFTGGTPHSIRHSFECVDVVDVIALRRSAGARTLQKFARQIFPENNFLGQALLDPQLPWSR